jgi:ankyrin repeat protein
MHLVIVALVLSASTGCRKPGGPVDDKSTRDPGGSPAAETGQQVEDKPSSGSPEKPRPKPSPYTERLAALMEAAEMGQVSRLLELLKEGGANLNDKDEHGQTVLMKAAAKGQITVVKLLVSQGVELDEQDDEGQTALMMAAQHGHVSVMRILIEPAKATTTVDDLLGKAAAEAKVPGLKLRTPEPASLNLRDKLGQTALFKAAVNGHEEAVSYLSGLQHAGEQQTDLKLKDNEGNTFWMAAAAKGHWDLAGYYARGHENETNRKGMTVLMMAAAAGEEAVVADILHDLPDHFNSGDAAKNKSKFLEYVNAKDKEGKTALQYAKAGGHGEVIKLLQKASAEDEKEDGKKAGG